MKKVFVAMVVCVMTVLAIAGCPDEKMGAEGGGASNAKQDDKGW